MIKKISIFPTVKPHITKQAIKNQSWKLPNFNLSKISKKKQKKNRNKNVSK